MEPWEQEWYYSRALEQRQAQRPRCRVCGEGLEQADALLYDGLCRYCQQEKNDE